jgi:hypothetical protein
MLFGPLRRVIGARRVSRGGWSSRHRDPDAWRVSRAAALLRVPEFAFFHLAHRRWFARAASDAEIEPYFMLYLYRGRVPFWVRHLARQVVAAAEAGAIRPEDWGAVPSLPPLPDGRGARAQALLLALVYGACFALVTFAAL